MFSKAPDCTGWHGLARVVQATWDAIESESPENVTMRAIAQRAGVSPTLMSYYFRRRTDLFEFVAAAALQALFSHIRRSTNASELGAAWLEFAANRPHAYRLAFDPTYAGSDRVSFQRQGVVNCIMFVCRDAVAQTSDELGFGVMAILHGAASVKPSIPWTLVQLEAYLATFRCRDPHAWAPSLSPQS